MFKQLTLFCTFAIFMLAVGGAVTPVWAHDDCGPGGKHSGDHPHCIDGPKGGGLYDVTVTGQLASNDTYTGHDPVGSAESVEVNFQFVDLNLHFFQSRVDGNGGNCFASAPVSGGQTVLSIALDDDQMSAWYFFTGYQNDGITEAGYLLKLWSSETYSPGWRPAGDIRNFTAKFNQWEIGGTAKGKKKSCNGRDIDLDTSISITRTN
jgi:hypothetical protein